jgi:hypothetical protein
MPPDWSYQVSTKPVLTPRKELIPSQSNSLFTKPIQEGETCLKPLKELLALNSDKVETLTHLIKKLEENKQVIGYHSNGLHATMCLTLLNYNKVDVLEMINNKIQLYETRK